MELKAGVGRRNAKAIDNHLLDQGGALHATDYIRQEEFASLTSIDIELDGATDSKLYLRKNRPRYPKWKALFPDIDWAKYMTNTFSGLLITNVSGRKFAIAGGSGRYLLNPFGTEADFGFKTLVNSVDPTTIRKIEKKAINQNPMNSIEQLTRTSGLGSVRGQVLRFAISL